jgi:hypothetical protein
MVTYKLQSESVTAVELKCLLVSRGVRCDKSVYKRLGETFRLNLNPLTCNCLLLSDGTVCQMTDLAFHLQYLSGALSWDNVKLLRYASQLGTPFSVKLIEDQAALLYEGELVDFVTFAPHTAFYQCKTPDGLPFLGNAVLQGLDWVAFQCLWPCEYAIAGKACEFCFSGAEFEANAKRSRAQPVPPGAGDVSEIVRYAAERVGVRGVQITGGSTLGGETEAAHIRAYLAAIRGIPLDERLLYITPPADLTLLDAYFGLGATRIACSLEVWELERAKRVTPGKIAFAGRERYLSALTYIAERYGPNKAFSNFIIGLEDYDELRIGAARIAERGVIPSASVWMPMGRPVAGSMKAPGLEEYRRVIGLFAELYTRYGLSPAGFRGLNVCIEADIKRFAEAGAAAH